MDAEARIANHHCPACRYDLTGQRLQDVLICPECGATSRAPAADARPPAKRWRLPIDATMVIALAVLLAALAMIALG